MTDCRGQLINSKPALTESDADSEHGGDRVVIKILIADDSNVVAMLLTSILEKQADFEVVGHAANGRSAVDMAQKLKPDVITMDVSMPEMDGIEATRVIMSSSPIPIVVVSSLVDNDEMKVSFRALEEGAVAVMGKPENLQDDVSDAYTEKLVETIRSMAGVKLVKRRSHPQASVPTTPPVRAKTAKVGCELVAIGGFTGAPQVLYEILKSLPVDFPVPILVVNHMSKGFTVGMAEWLARHSGPAVTVAEHGEVLKAGTVYLAPDDGHLMVARPREELTAVISEIPPINRFRPSVTPLMQSAALICGNKAVGLILSGMGTDGAEGLLAIRQAGGQTFVQSEDSCVVFGMPGEAVRIGAASKTLSPDLIAPRLLSLVLQNGILAQA